MTTTPRGPLSSTVPPESTIVGGVYNAVPPAPQDEQPVALQVDAQGRLLVTTNGGMVVGGIVQIEDSSGNVLNSNGAGALQVAVVSGGGSNPSVGVNNTPAPASSTEIGTIDAGGNLQGVSASNPLPITGSISASNPSVGTTGAAAPTSATEIGIINGGGNLTGVSPTTPLPISATAAANASGNPIFTESVGTSTVEVAGIIGTSTVTVAGGIVASVTGTATVEVAGILGTSTVEVAGIVGTSTVTVAGTVTVVGNLTNNNVAPTANNLGVLPAIANAVHPNWTEGDQVLGSVNTIGYQRVAQPSRSVSLGDGGSNAAAFLADDVENVIVNLEYGFWFNGTTWDRQRSATIGNNVAATGLAIAEAYGQYNASLPTITTGNYTSLQTDINGRLITTGVSAASITGTATVEVAGIVGTSTVTVAGPVTVVGDAASGAAVAGNPVLVAGEDTAGKAQPIAMGSLVIPGVIINSQPLALSDGANQNTYGGGLVSTNGTTTALQVFQNIFNGTTWDRMRSGSVLGATMVQVTSTPTVTVTGGIAASITGTATVEVAGILGTSTVEVAGIVGTSTVTVAGGIAASITGTATVEVAGILGTSTVEVAGIVGTSTVTVAGTVTVVGDAASGAAAAGNPVLIAGKDTSGNARSLLIAAANGVPCLLANYTGADAFSNAILGLFMDSSGNEDMIVNGNYIFNGTTWDRARSGSVTGASMVQVTSTPTVVVTGTSTVVVAGAFVAETNTTTVTASSTLAVAASTRWNVLAINFKAIPSNTLTKQAVVWIVDNSSNVIWETQGPVISPTNTLCYEHILYPSAPIGTTYAANARNSNTQYITLNMPELVLGANYQINAALVGAAGTVTYTLCVDAIVE